MREALAVAASGLAAGELPIGAVVVLDNKIIGAAYTREQAEGRLLVHADFLALDAADRLKPFPGNRREAALFVTLEPCLMCMGAAMSFCLGSVYYALESPGDGATTLVQQWQRQEQHFPQYRVPTIIGGVLRSDARAQFQTYCRQHTTGSVAEWARTIASL
jgi:tRNA(adenine34) deaminase